MTMPYSDLPILLEKIAEKLRRDPHLAADLYSFLSGSGTQDADPVWLSPSDRRATSTAKMEELGVSREEWSLLLAVIAVSSRYASRDPE